MRKRARTALIIVALSLLLAGCSTVCRHDVMRHVVWALEQGYETQVVSYKMTLPARLLTNPVYTHHVQARAVIGGEWKWLGEAFGTIYLCDDPAYPMGARSYQWTPEEYLAQIRANGLDRLAGMVR